MPNCNHNLLSYNSANRVYWSVQIISLSIVQFKKNLLSLFFTVWVKIFISTHPTFCSQLQYKRKTVVLGAEPMPHVKTFTSVMDWLRRALNTSCLPPPPQPNHRFAAYKQKQRLLLLLYVLAHIHSVTGTGDTYSVILPTSFLNSYARKT
jgi:hypothetical protein